MESHKISNKNTLFLVTAVILLLVLLSYNLNAKNLNNRNSSFVPFLSATSEKDLTKESWDAMTRYLEGFKYPNKFSDDAIEDYSIESVTQAFISNGKLHFNVVYSVAIAHGEDTDSYWEKGKEVLKNGWITNKSAEAIAVFLNGHYVVIDLGTKSF